MASYKYLDLSWEHIAAHDRLVLDHFEQNVTAGLNVGIRVTKFQAGYFIRGSCLWPPADEGERRFSQNRMRAKFLHVGFSDEFCSLIVYAQGQEAHLIQIYESGEYSDELAKFIRTGSKS